ncbi:MAG: SCO7613 C-terminal domain-containing membrane protein [Candidatus Promineifilaceae bacterium]
MCETAFSRAEFDKLRQLDYLLRATEDWSPNNMIERRQRYMEANAQFREQAFARVREMWRLKMSPPEKAPLPKIEPLPEAVLPTEKSPQTAESLPVQKEPIEAVVPVASAEAAKLQPIAAQATPQTQSVPSPPKRTFEQWLFSENTIKSAIYSGAALFILAGFIFVGANWSRLPGVGKLAVTLVATTLTCRAGFSLMMRSKTLRIGGLALLGISAGFAPLNPYVVDAYLVDLDVTTMWLFGSLACTLFYIWLLRHTKTILFGLFVALGVICTQSSVYAVLNANGTIMATLIMLLPFTLLWIALRWREKRYVFRPNYTLAHIIAFFAYCAILIATVATDTPYPDHTWSESHWWFVIAVVIGCGFYVANFHAIKSQLSEILAATAFGSGSIILTTHLVNFYLTNRSGGSNTEAALGITFALLMAFYLVIGFAASRYRLWLHGTGVLLSLLAISMTWEIPLAATIVLLTVAVVYAFAAAHYHFPWLIVPSLIALYLTVWSFWQIGEVNIEPALILSYAGIAVLLLGIGRWFRTRQTLTCLLLMVAGSVTLAASFLVSLSAENKWLAVWLSLVVALVCLTLTWLERESLLDDTFKPKAPILASPGFLTGVAALAIFAGHFNLMAVLSNNQDGNWPLISVGLSSAFVLISWLLRSKMLHKLFGLPLNVMGFATSFVPFLFAFEFDWWVLSTVSVVIGAVAMADGWVRRSDGYRRCQILAGAGMLIWALLASVSAENQWLAVWLALGIALICLALTWIDRKWLLNTPFGSNNRAVPGILTALAALAVFIGHFNLMKIVLDNRLGNWPVISVGVSVAFILISWRLRFGVSHKLFGLPLSVMGFATSAVPFASAIGFDWWVMSTVAALIGAMAIADGWLRRDVGKRRYQILAGVGVLMWALLASISAENQWLAVWLATGIALVCLALTWAERKWLLNHPFGYKNQAVPGFLTAVAALAIFIGHFNLIAILSNNQMRDWPLISVGLSAAFVVLSWLLRSETQHKLFGLPLNAIGFATSVVPLAFMIEFGWWMIAIVCAVVGAIAVADGWLRRGTIFRRYQLFAGLGLFISAWWAILAHNGIEEVQWYVLPLGLTLLLMALAERQAGREIPYRLFTFLGLMILFSTALAQSFDHLRYALLLLVESLLAIAIGVQIRSRAYVQFGLFTLIANGLIQYGPAFANLPRFVQLGTIGSTLLTLGLLALFRREQILRTRDLLQEGWREWDA